jgi:hypothetical protein
MQITMHAYIYNISKISVHVFQLFIEYYCRKIKRGCSGHVARSGRCERKNVNGTDNFRYMERDETIILILKKRDARG